MPKKSRGGRAKMKKVIIALIACIVVAGIAITCVMGLNYELMYSQNTQLDIYIGKEFQDEEVQSIVREVIGQDKKVITQKVEIYEDMVTITVPEITTEQIEQINQKMNEKYGLDNQVEDIQVVHNTKIRGREMVRPYVLPVAISFLIILIVFTILYRQLSMMKVLGNFIGYTFLVQALYLSIIALTRVEVNRFTMPIAIALFAITQLAVAIKLEKKRLNQIKEEQK